MGSAAVFLEQVDAAVRSAADHAIFTVQTWFWHPSADLQIAGRTVCEVGPGADAAATLLLAGMRADCIMVDREEKVWDAVSHPLLVAEFHRRRDEAPRPFDIARLRSCIEQASFAPVPANGPGGSKTPTSRRWPI